MAGKEVITKFIFILLLIFSITLISADIPQVTISNTTTSDNGIPIVIIELPSTATSGGGNGSLSITCPDGYALQNISNNLAECINISSGSQGPIGPTGPQGPAGADGTNGTNGIDGVNGTNGIDGVNGTNGINGVNGTSLFTNINLTQFDNSTGTLNIIVSWLNSLYYLNSNPSNFVNGSYYPVTATYNKSQIDTNMSLYYLKNNSNNYVNSTYNATYAGLINNVSYINNNTNHAFINQSQNFTGKQTFTGNITIGAGAFMKNVSTPVGTGILFGNTQTRNWNVFDTGSGGQYGDVQFVGTGKYESGSYNSFRISFDTVNNVHTLLFEPFGNKTALSAVFEALPASATGTEILNQFKLFPNGNILLGGSSSITTDNNYTLHVAGNLFVNNEGVFGSQANCQGTPSVTDCTTYANQTSCELNQNHGSCIWGETSGSCTDNPTLDCSGYNEGDCTARTYCTANYGTCDNNPALDCSTMDEGTCNSYSAGCTNNGHTYPWISCTDTINFGCFAYLTEADCTADILMIGGCQNNYGDVWNGCSTTGSCSSFAYGSCPTTNGCSANPAFTSCSNNGACSSVVSGGTECNSYSGCLWVGTNSCSGTATCNGITGSLSTCNIESGCNWTTFVPSLYLFNNGVSNNQNVSIEYDGVNANVFITNGTLRVFNGTHGNFTSWGAVEAKQFITHTKVNNDTKVLSSFKSPSELKKDGVVNYSAFGDCMTITTEIDYSQPVEAQECVNETNVLGIKFCKKYQSKTTYPNFIYSKGVDMVCIEAQTYNALYQIKQCTASSKSWNEYQLCVGGL